MQAQIVIADVISTKLIIQSNPAFRAQKSPLPVAAKPSWPTLGPGDLPSKPTPHQTSTSMVRLNALKTTMSLLSSQFHSSRIHSAQLTIFTTVQSGTYGTDAGIASSWEPKIFVWATCKLLSTPGFGCSADAFALRGRWLQLCIVTPQEGLSLAAALWFGAAGSGSHS